MTLRQRLMHEIKTVALVTVYFGAWIGVLIALKTLVLSEYRIPFNHWSLALFGALVLAKVVLVLEHVPLGSWVRAQPAWVDVALRTALYAVGVAAVLVMEKGLEARHEYGGFGPAVAALFHKTDVHHVWANTIALSGALFGYNVLSVVRQHLGENALRRMFLAPLPSVGATSEQHL